MPERLGISPTVYGRRTSGNRVLYLLHADGSGAEFGVPERVVLFRWRKRVKNGFTFSGARLSPTFWRAMRSALGPDVATWHTFDEKAVVTRIAPWKAKQPAVRGATQTRDTQPMLKLPAGNVVHAILQTCGPAKLQALVERHARLAEIKESGVPDLFLSARDLQNKLRLARFAEVKRFDERVRPGQTSEHDFMYALGIPAKTLRLKERTQSYSAIRREPAE